jgi:hypothetical protein
MVRAILFATLSALLMFWITAPRKGVRASYSWLEGTTARNVTTYYGDGRETSTIRADGSWDYTSNRVRPNAP